MSDSILSHLQPVMGIMVIIALGWALSENRRAFSVRLVASALVLQAAIAILLLKLPPARQALLGSIRW